MTAILVSIASPAKHEALNQLYESWDYHGGIAAADIVYVANVGEQPVGLVRRTLDFGVTMLRGLYVAPEHRRRRVGSELLRRFVVDLPSTPCFCIPFAHLTSFYAVQGFAVIDEAGAGPMLRERLALYRAEGHAVVLMRRDAARHDHK